MSRHLSGAALLLLLLLLLLIALSATPSAAIPIDSTTIDGLQELDPVIEALRTHGYNLFTNAITVSDLQFQLFSAAAPPFTIFAPRDSDLYALDMASDDAAYLSTLRYHVAPNRRLTIFDLRNATSPLLETLLPHYTVFLSTSIDNSPAARFWLGGDDMDVVRVDGVQISDPDLYVGSRIVVHGLDGILVTGLVKNEDLLPADNPPPVQLVAPAPARRRRVTNTTAMGTKMNKKPAKHHHRHRHRRNRTHRRQSRVGDHRNDDL